MPAGANVLGPILQMFGQTPEEQQQNIKALLGEIQGMSSTQKASQGYTPMMVMMMERMAQNQMQRQMMQNNYGGSVTPMESMGMGGVGGGSNELGNLDPNVIGALLRGIR